MRAPTLPGIVAALATFGCGDGGSIPLRVDVLGGALREPVYIDVRWSSPHATGGGVLGSWPRPRTESRVAVVENGAIVDALPRGPRGLWREEVDEVRLRADGAVLVLRPMERGAYDASSCGLRTAADGIVVVSEPERDMPTCIRYNEATTREIRLAIDVTPWNVVYLRGLPPKISPHPDRRIPPSGATATVGGRRLGGAWPSPGSDGLDVHLQAVVVSNLVWAIHARDASPWLTRSAWQALADAPDPTNGWTVVLTGDQVTVTPAADAGYAHLLVAGFGEGDAITQVADEWLSPGK